VGGGSALVAWRRSDIAASAYTVGTVTGYREARTSTGGRRLSAVTQVPQVSFMTADGQSVQAENGTSYGLKPYQEGQRVSLWYRMDDPKKVVIDRKLDIYGVPGGLIAVGALVLAGACWPSKKNPVPAGTRPRA
jgi:hypothetical protein